MWIFRPRPSAHCRCWTTRCWWSAAPTACRPTPRRCGSCWARYRVPTFVFVNKMDLPGADAAVRLRELRGPFWRRLHRFYRRARRRSAGAVQRTADGGSAGCRRAAPRHAGAGHCAAAGVPLLFWRGAAPAGPGRAAARAADADAHAAHLAGVWRAGVQDQPGRRRRAADLAEGDRRHAAGKSRAARRRESRRAAAVQRQQVPAGERRGARHGGGGGRPGPHAPRPGPGGRSRRRSPAAGTGAELPRQLPRRRPAHAAARAAHAGGRGPAAARGLGATTWPRCMCS